MGLGAKREIYSGYEPSWIFAHTAPYWIQELQDEKILPTAKELLMNGGVDENFCYVSEEEISDLFTWLVPQAMSHHDERSDMNRTVLEPVAVNEFLAPVREKQVLSHPNCLCVIQMSVANTMWYLHTHFVCAIS